MAATEKDHAVIAIAKQLNHLPEGEEYEKMISGMLYVLPLLLLTVFQLPLRLPLPFPPGNPLISPSDTTPWSLN